MSILIKGMEMPNRCPECPCAYWTEGAHYDYCQAMGYDNKWKIYESDSRPDWCPLIPVPKHGDLIDRAELLKKFCGHCFDEHDPEWDFRQCEGECFDLKLIKNTPTIIPADEGGDAQ